MHTFSEPNMAFRGRRPIATLKRKQLPGHALDALLSCFCGGQPRAGLASRSSSAWDNAAVRAALHRPYVSFLLQVQLLNCVSIG